MKKHLKYFLLIVLGFVFLGVNSCGMFEREDIKEQTLSNGYKIFYDTNGIAYNYIKILKTNGAPLLNNCTEFYIKDDYLYATVKDDYLTFFKIRNSDKKVFKIVQSEYDKNIINDSIVKYDNLK